MLTNPRHLVKSTSRIITVLACLIVLVGCNLPVKVDVSIFPTATSQATATATVTTTPTPAPTATPTPTPQPAARVEIAEQALFIGDYEQARRQFIEAQSVSSDPAILAAAELGLGRTLYFQDNYQGAVDALQAYTASHPDDDQLAVGYYFLGLCYEAQFNYLEAADAYNRYIELRPGVLDDYLHELRGDAYMAAGMPGSAVEAYEAAISAGGQRITVWTEMKLGRAYAQDGDFSNAIKRFIEIYEKTDNEYAKAQANLLMGQTYLTMGMPEQAYARFQDSVSNYPMAYDSYSGLVALVNGGMTVSELERGIVDYYAGQYGLAVEALTRYIDSTTDPDASAYHFRALSRRALGDSEAAVADWDTIITDYPGTRFWSTAWSEKAYTQWAWLDRFPEAAQTLLTFVDENPESADAPDFLFDAARVLERNKQFDEAAETWVRLMDNYPSAELSYRGLFLAGVTYFRAEDYPNALLTFQRALVLTSEPGEQAAAYLWIGKVQQAQGDTAAMQSAWEQAVQRDPTGYYSERANELLLGQKPFVPTRPYDLGYDLQQERGKAEEWLRSTFALPPETDLSGLGELANDERLIRANALWELSEYTMARNEFEEVRKSILVDAAAQYRLMNHMYNLGVYRSALLASRHILDLANLDDVGTLEAPAYFNHIRFGIYYKDLILQASQDEEIHPLLLLSVIRQESLFEGFATSSSGARGLMQIMPATGQEIAANMQWPEGYAEDDLYRPWVSIRMGARYLARQREYFNGNMYEALAAYNGGPGNTIIWAELAGGDPDLLLEVIRAEETRRYITQIYEFYNLYRLLYERGL